VAALDRLTGFFSSLAAFFKSLAGAITAAILLAGAIGGGGLAIVNSYIGPKSHVEQSSFRTPSANIECRIVAGLDSDASDLRCVIHSGLIPELKCHTGNVDAVLLPQQAGPRPECSEPAFAEPPQLVLAYGERWQVTPWRCLSQQNGLRCKNEAGKGFFLSRRGWHPL
jgi:hypothetical protein